MTASADITVIPTGSGTPVDLADIAAAAMAVPAPQILIWPGSASIAGVSTLGLVYAKQTHVIENCTCVIDGTDDVTSTANQLQSNVPDGLYNISYGPVPSTTGTHTVVIAGVTSGASNSTTYTIP
jgi:hypothetical protein